MSSRQIRVAFIYRPSWKFITGNFRDKSWYYFFMHALKRNPNMSVSYLPAEHSFDTTKLHGKYDVILCTNHRDWTPNLENIRRSEMPVIAYCNDFHYVKKWDQIPLHEEFKINRYFGFMAPSYFYKYYPKHFKYSTIFFGVEPSLYSDYVPFEGRIKDRILVTGRTPASIKSMHPAIRKMALSRYDWCNKVFEPPFPRRIIRRILQPGLVANWNFYMLRTMCRYLPYVDYSGIDPKTDKFTGAAAGNYAQYLSSYRAAVAATTFYPVIKYWETAAAGCLTFMEITEKNDGQYLGYRDGKTAVFINKKNYKKKFQKYLDDPDDPKWARIAEQGRQYTMENFTNDIAAQKLADLMRELI